MSVNGMPPHLLALFQVRPPLEYVQVRKKRPYPKVMGLANFLNDFETTPPPVVEPFETPQERKENAMREKVLKYEQELSERIRMYKPLEDKNAEGDPFRTLFVARVSYETTEKKLRKEFESYGRIKSIRMITDLNTKPRGYAFIEFEDGRDMKEAYKMADGKKIDGRRVLVDVERARTVPGWLPRRLGGGRGPPRGAKEVKRQTPVPQSTNLVAAKEVAPSNLPTLQSQRQAYADARPNYYSNPNNRQQSSSRHESRLGRGRDRTDRDRDRDRKRSPHRRDRSRSPRERSRSRDRSREHRDRDRDRGRR